MCKAEKNSYDSTLVLQQYMDNYDRFDDEDRFKQHKEHKRREDPSKYEKLRLIGPDEFEDKSEEEKDGIYREVIYPELERIKEQNEDLRQQNSDQITEAQKWRRKSWGWRLGSFVLGIIIGGLV